MRLFKPVVLIMAFACLTLTGPSAGELKKME